MQMPELLAEIAEARAKPLQIECQRPDGSRTVCSVEECSAHGWRYVHIAADRSGRAFRSYFERHARPAAQIRQNAPHSGPLRLCVRRFLFVWIVLLFGVGAA